MGWHMLEKSDGEHITSHKMRSAPVSEDTEAIMKKFINIYRICKCDFNLFLTI